VPTGNHTVTITTDRRRVTAPVVANVYYATGLHAIRASDFTTTTDGQVTTEEQGCAVFDPSQSERQKGDARNVKTEVSATVECVINLAAPS
jgi:hypothetical protein